MPPRIECSLGVREEGGRVKGKGTEGVEQDEAKGGLGALEKKKIKRPTKMLRPGKCGRNRGEGKKRTRDEEGDLLAMRTKSQNRRNFCCKVRETITEKGEGWGNRQGLKTAVIAIEKKLTKWRDRGDNAPNTKNCKTENEFILRPRSV